MLKELYKILERNGYVSDEIKEWNLYKLLETKILPYYDNSKFRTSNALYAFRKIVTVDDVCKCIGEYKRYPLFERDLIMLALLSDLHKIKDPFDKKIEHSTHIADDDFHDCLKYFFGTKETFDTIITDTYSRRTANRLESKALHDINILVRMDPMWYFKSVWHDYYLMKTKDLDDFNHGEPSKFKPSEKSKDMLMYEAWRLLYRESISTSVNWEDIFIPEIKASMYFSEKIESSMKAIKSFDIFKDIVKDLKLS